MIETIKMRNCATYNDEGAILDNCAKINFIYGANGSGKTTIGNYLSNLDDSVFSDCEILFDGDESDIIVYNRKFRESQILMGDIPGVFTLGRATKETIEEIASLKREREKAQNEYKETGVVLAEKERKRVTDKNSVKDELWNRIYIKYKDRISFVFDGVRASKDKFYEKIMNVYRLQGGVAHDIEKLCRAAKTVISEDTDYKLFSLLSEDSLKILHDIENDEIWGKSIVGKEDLPIGKLIKHLNHSDWVHKGYSYIQGTTCPFCQQNTISNSFKNQIEEFFSGEYEKDLEYLCTLNLKYNEASKKLLACLEEVKHDQLRLITAGLDADEFNSAEKSFISLIEKNCYIIESKLKEPGKKVNLSSTKDNLDFLIMLIKKGNERLNEHNNIIANKESMKKELKEDFWEHFVEANRDYISYAWENDQNIAKAIDGLKKKKGTLRYKIEELNKSIQAKEKETTSVQPAIDNINSELANFGFTGFRIVPSERQKNFYQIKRGDGTLVENTLSEGEETFITFLYFMQMCGGAIKLDKVSSKKILIIDDPICSLDSNVLFIVSSIIKELIKEIKENRSDVEQLFILTHNVYFHKETSFIDGRTKELNDVHYWMLRKIHNITQIIPYEKINPIKSSYEMLWNEIREDHGSYIGIRNAMRRILENYFSMLGENWGDALINKFDVLEEKMMCRSLLYWVNDGSHSISDDLYIDDNPDMICQYKEVFRKMFIQMGHEAHYNMMMKINS